MRALLLSLLLEAVAELDAQRTPKQRTSRAVDAFSARVVSRIAPFPDPRQYISESCIFATLPVNPFGPQAAHGGFEVLFCLVDLPVLKPETCDPLKGVLTRAEESSLVNFSFSHRVKAASEQLAFPVPSLSGVGQRDRWVFARFRFHLQSTLVDRGA
jgi:hypothetical protein